MKLAIASFLLILCSVGCKSSQAPVPGQGVRFPNAEITIGGVGVDDRPYSSPAARPGMVSGSMFCSVGDERWDLSWTYVGTTDIGDVYEFITTRGPRGKAASSPSKPHPEEPRTVQALVYSGTAATVYSQDKGKIIIAPARH